MKVVLDSNIFISAFLKGDLAGEVIDLAVSKLINVYLSREIIEEIEKILKNKFHVRDNDIGGFVHFLLSTSTIVQPKNKIEKIVEDPEDSKILECALEAGADLIITLDHHLLKLKRFKSVSIIHLKTLTWMIPDY